MATYCFLEGEFLRGSAQPPSDSQRHDGETIEGRRENDDHDYCSVLHEGGDHSGIGAAGAGRRLLGLCGLLNLEEKVS